MDEGTSVVLKLKMSKGTCWNNIENMFRLNKV